MLLVMAGMLVCEIFTVVFGGWFFTFLIQSVATMTSDSRLHTSAGRHEEPLRR
ncbi:MAG TPA: hypothetical protein VD738_07360 [Nitrospira sp.]|jgi:hypothetical protein|nr:hypothetical protein [Nitrospira sp.]